MKKLVFATQNKNKVEEIQQQVQGYYEVESLLDLGWTEELEESQETLEGNASQKVQFVYRKFNCNAFADDTGLEVEALNGRPGVYSARYAGPQKSFEDNMNKILEELNGLSNRRAQFRTVIALVLDGKEYFFEGICKGRIAETKKGDKGFGYDPVFIPDGEERSFAEMSMAEKAAIGHRGKAVQLLLDFLLKQ